MMQVNGSICQVYVDVVIGSVENGLLEWRSKFRREIISNKSNGSEDEGIKLLLQKDVTQLQWN